MAKRPTYTAKCWIKAIIFLAYSSSVICHPSSTYAVAPASVYIEDMTWPEVSERLKKGTTTAIIPTGGTAQNGPHMVTGRENIVARHTAGEIAQKLGDALVAPVVAYTPQGRIYPPEGHMQFPGTVSLSDRAFAALLEDAARSLKQHGFKLICFIGESGGSQAVQQKVAEQLTEEWAREKVVVLQVSDYYARNGQEKWTETTGIKVANPKAHAGLIETSELMAIDASGVRDTMRADHNERDYKTTGAIGDSSQASAKYGRKYLGMKIDAAIKQIQDATSHAQ